MHIGDFDFYRDYLRKKCGLALTQDQSYLLNSRLTPVAKKWNFATLEAMTMTLRGVPDLKLVRDVIEAMVIGETSFFNDAEAFQLLRRVAAPRLRRNRKKLERLHVWSAGCGTGQEAFSLAMALNEAGVRPAAEIMATDISETYLAQAKRGEYGQFEVQRGLPTPLLVKYFRPLASGNWRARRSLQKMITFRPFNVLNKNGMPGPFDLIFCCNLLNSFDEDIRRQVLAAMAGRLMPDGILVLGAGENAEIGGFFEPLPDAPRLNILRKGA